MGGVKGIFKFLGAGAVKTDLRLFLLHITNSNHHR